MNSVEFKNKSAQKLYKNYLKNIERHTSVLSGEDAQDILMEFNSHIYEGMQSQDEPDEVERIISVLDRLGDPAETLKPLAAGKKLNQATRTFNPKHVLQALSMNLKNSFAFGIFGILYLLLFVLLLLIPVKIFFPGNTGLFYLNDQFVSFGINSNTEGLNELLGYWIIPIVLVIAFIIYIIITLIMRLWRRK